MELVHYLTVSSPQQSPTSLNSPPNHLTHGQLPYKSSHHALICPTFSETRNNPNFFNYRVPGGHWLEGIWCQYVCPYKFIKKEVFWHSIVWMHCILFNWVSTDRYSGISNETAMNTFTLFCPIIFLWSITKSITAELKSMFISISS